MSRGAKSTGRPTADIRADHLEWAGEQPTRTSCAFCPWTFTGTADEGRKQAAEHRAEHHPNARRTRRRRSGMLQRFIQPDDGFQKEGQAAAAEVAAMHRRRESEAA